MAKSIFGGLPSLAHAGAADPALTAEFQDTTCNGTFTVLTGTADPIPFPGNVAVNSAGVNAMTLAPPLPGPQPVGDDGKTIFVVALNAAAHTITTPTNKILGSKHLATFTAAIGNNITLTALNGVWVVNQTPVGVTVT